MGSGFVECFTPISFGFYRSHRENASPWESLKVSHMLLTISINISFSKVNFFS